MQAPKRYPQSTTHWEAISLLLVDAWQAQTLEAGLCNDKITHLNKWFNQHYPPSVEKPHDTGESVNRPRD